MIITVTLTDAEWEAYLATFPPNGEGESTAPTTEAVAAFLKRALAEDFRRQLAKQDDTVATAQEQTNFRARQSKVNAWT